MASNLPTPVKTWQYNVNNLQTAQSTAATSVQLLWVNIFAAMLGFASSPWTVSYSCNSVTAGTAGDGVNRLTSLSNIVDSSGATAHSWIVLKQPGMGASWQLLITFHGFGVNQPTFYISPSAGFTGGSTTVDPNATDQFQLGATASDGNYNFGSNVTNISYRWSVIQSTDGKSTRIICTGNSAVQGSIFIENLNNITTGFSNVGVLFQNGRMGLYNASKHSTTLSLGSFSYESAALITVVSDIDTNWPMLPLAIVGTTAGARGRWGMFNDLWIGSTSTAIGDTYPGTSETPQFQFATIATNNLIIPWNQTAFQLS